MKAWGESAPAVLDELEADVATYRAGGESASTLVWQTCTLLELPLPQITTLAGTG